jgi:hypothetical protein
VRLTAWLFSELLGHQLETLILTGAASHCAFGNALSNVISRHNTLMGNAGKDSFTGSAGVDSMDDRSLSHSPLAGLNRRQRCRGRSHRVQQRLRHQPVRDRLSLCGGQRDAGIAHLDWLITTPQGKTSARRAQSFCSPRTAAV